MPLLPILGMPTRKGAGWAACPPAWSLDGHGSFRHAFCGKLLSRVGTVTAVLPSLPPHDSRYNRPHQPAVCFDLDQEMPAELCVRKD
jgi:hypothetical protein